MRSPTPSSRKTGFGALGTWLFAVLTLISLFSITYGNVTTQGARDLTILVVATLCVLALIVGFRQTIAATATGSIQKLNTLPLSTFILVVCLLGIGLRVAWSIEVPPVQTSDPATYLTLAEHLLATGTYEIGGTKAHWPPGYPLFLYIFLAAFGPSPYLALFINLGLFLATTLVAFALARLVVGAAGARLVVVLLAVWPTLIMGAGIANKEYLVAFLVALSAYCYLRAEDGPELSGRSLAKVFLAGICLGGAVLTQPSMLVIGGAFPSYEIMRRVPLKVFAAKLVLLMLGGAVVIAPWTARNYAVLHSFVPISTNGGIVFWSANNDEATGGWIEADYRRFLTNELEGARQAWQEAFAWIKAHPKQFAALSIKRQVRFYSSDDSGAVASLYLPTKEPSPAYEVTTWIANAFWFFLIALLLASVAWHIGRKQPIHLRCGLMVLLILYLSLIHTFFQSEGKHHLNVMVMFAILAAIPMEDRERVGEPARR